MQGRLRVLKRRKAGEGIGGRAQTQGIYAVHYVT